jgi:hypothetical protein
VSVTSDADEIKKAVDAAIAKMFPTSTVADPHLTNPGTDYAVTA